MHIPIYVMSKMETNERKYEKNDRCTSQAIIVEQ
jgi:hypothetical protein